MELFIVTDLDNFQTGSKGSLVCTIENILPLIECPPAKRGKPSFSLWVALMADRTFLVLLFLRLFHLSYAQNKDSQNERWLLTVHSVIHSAFPSNGALY